MKKNLLLLLPFIFCSIFSKAQQTPPNWLWLQGSGGSGYQYGGGVGTDDSGNIYIGGRFGSTITFGTQSENATTSLSHLFGKFNPSGTCVWLSQEGGGGFDYPRGFCVDKANPNNEYQDGNENSGDGMFVDKVNNDGVVQWEATVGTSSYDGYGSSPNGDGIAADAAGNVYATGETGDGSWTMGDSTLTCGTAGGYWPQAQEAFLTKLDKNGNFLWAVGVRGINAANEGYDVGRAVILDKTAQYVYVAGGYQDTTVFHSKYPSGDITMVGPSGSASDLYLAKYDTAGDLLSVATAANAGLPWINGFNSGVGASYGLAIDSCGTVYITGGFSGTVTFGPFTLTAQGTNDGFLATCNSMGQWQWVDDFGGSGGSAGGGNVALDKNNDVYTDGSFKGTANFGNGVSLTSASSQGSLFIAKFANSTGAVQWAQTSTGTGNNGAGGLTVDTNKFVVIDGTFYNSFGLPGTQTLTATGGESNIFLAKLDTVPTLYIVPVVDTIYCVGEVTTLSYTVIGNFNSGNTFTAELSDSTGSFVDDTDIGSVTSNSNGTITITIPANTPPGSNYLIRVVSSNPATSSYVNGCGAYYQSNVYINNFYVTIGSGSSVTPTISPLDTTVCTGATVNLTASGGISYSWSNGDTGTVITLNPTTDSVITLTAKGGCGTSASITDTITVNPAPPLIVQPPSPESVCLGLGITLTVPVSGSDYTWSPSLSLSTSTGDTVIASPTLVTTYTVAGTDSLGCTVSGTEVIYISIPPAKPVITIIGDTLISSATQGNQWLRNDSTIAGATNQTYVTIIHGYYQVIAENPANGCNSTSDSSFSTSIYQISAISNQLSIYPNPTGGEIYVNINSSAPNVKDWTLQITDVLGRTIYTRSSLNYSNAIDLSHLPSGVYFITIINNTSRSVFPVVKQN